ncbi:hypothetical protein Y1Q_0009930 [Alligator mississippiensis]|uniref:Uncharacterized protein n=1 Tax=Alligator mississippiensis TaxID=8496 RepID=A0A151MXF5_ALLMI|nr:hypothetical protein Y1Q_0009930 [Alligator mississippiensis]
MSGVACEQAALPLGQYGKLFRTFDITGGAEYCKEKYDQNLNSCGAGQYLYSILGHETFTQVSKGCILKMRITSASTLLAAEYYFICTATSSSSHVA